MIGLFIISFIELLWEFHHHYYYPESLKVWVENGNKAEDFSKNYDNNIVGTIGAIGRLTIYTIILWLSIGLYKIRKVNLWNPILTSFFCVLGIISSVLMFLFFNSGIETPKELGFSRQNLHKHMRNLKKEKISFTGETLIKIKKLLDFDLLNFF